MRYPGTRASGKQFSQPASTSGGPIKRRRAMLAAALLGATLVGCDMQKLESPTAQADRKVDEFVAKADGQLVQAPGALGGYITTLDQAAEVAEASNSDRALTKGMLADAEVAEADNQLSEVDHQELEVRRLVWEIGQITEHAQRMRDMAKVLKENNDPASERAKPAVDAIEQEHKHCEEEVSKTKQEIESLTAEIQKGQADIASLKSQQAKAAQSGDALAEQSSQINTQQALDTYVKSTQAHSLAGKLGAQADAATADLIPFQNKLAIAQAKLAFAGEAIKELDERKASLDQQWQDLQGKEIAPQEEAAKVLAESVSVADPSEEDKSSKVQHLENLLKTVDTQRQEAAKRLIDAVKHYSEADAAGKKVTVEMSAKLTDEHFRDSPAKSAWTLTKDIFNPTGYQELQGTAQLILGDLYVVEAQEIRARQQVATITGPALQQALDQAMAAGKTAYGEAVKTVEPIANAPTATAQIKQDSHFVKAMSLYGLCLLTQDQSHLGEAHKAADEGTPRIELPPDPSSPAPAAPPAATP